MLGNIWIRYCEILFVQKIGYKKAIPYEKALDIIDDDVKGNFIDADLLDMFAKEKVYALVREDK